MKLKFIPRALSISLLTLVLVMAFSMPATAQKTAKEEKSSQDRSSADRIKSEDSSNRSKSDMKTATSSKNADYWFDKGALCATYGNDQAAIEYYKKVISLDPARSDAYFAQGISYGQLEKFDRALTLVNKAIEMEPANGLYIYGRGRVHLLAGDKDKAMADFQRAAELNDEDALNYLEHVARH